MADSKVEDLRLPAAVIARIVKDALPPNAAVSKEAKTALARAAAVFILNVTTAANEYADGNKRKTIAATDIYHAIKVLDCEQLEKPLHEAVEAWKADKSAKADEAKKRRAEKKANDVRDIEDM
ncbi:hypothetical protein PFISCL1PPCAC_25254 [Pristionchus fissidentatus]|uniref:DNA polymerase epsilon subunit 3 n=1 Tax=Pristionchus fissidentatus TaxID=1538716 RepID=A0AAV5WW28_9BILA|nr:hypothetical protein PFISCL1PPCAC_25254 [Pristionchus fissidentatus]